MLPDGDRVGRVPGSGCVAEQLELDRQPRSHLFGPTVDAGGQRDEHLSHVGRDRLPGGIANRAHAKRSHFAVAGQEAAAENLGQLAADQPPLVVELPEPLLRHDVAQAEEEIGLVVRRDVGDSPGIAPNLDRRADRPGDLVAAAGERG